MARCCGSTGTCACKIDAGRHVTVTGTGTSQDPFVVATDTDLDVVDTPQFDLTLSGLGTLESPWLLSVDYAATAALTNLPDVNAPAPTNGHVLTWDSGTERWVSQAGTTASPGVSVTGTSIEGDGSVGDPLEVTPDPDRYLTVTVDGLGLTDEGINRLVRVFADLAARTAADPAPAVGTISMLEDEPGRLDYWDGAAWVEISNGIGLQVISEAFHELSGPYNGGPVVWYTARIATTTSGSGEFTVIPVLNLAGRAGVLVVTVQPSGNTGAGWTCTVHPATTYIRAFAFSLVDGSPYAGQAITAMVTALLY